MAREKISVPDFLKACLIYYKDLGKTYFEFEDKYFNLFVLQEVNNWGFWNLNDFMVDYRKWTIHNQIELYYKNNTLFLKWL